MSELGFLGELKRRHLVRVAVVYAAAFALLEFADIAFPRLGLGSNFIPGFHAYVGDKERALTALEEAYAERSGSRSLLSMRIEPGYDFMRRDPRFVDLLERVGLGGEPGA